MWLVLHYYNNGDEVLVNMNNIVRISTRKWDPIDGDVVTDHTVLTAKICQIHVKESIEEIYQMIRSKS